MLAFRIESVLWCCFTVVVSGNTIAPLPSGGSIGVGLAVDAIGRPIPGGPTSGFFPKTMRIENNAIVAASEYTAMAVSASAVRTTAVISGNSFGGGQKAVQNLDRNTDWAESNATAAGCTEKWLFYCTQTLGGLSGQLTASGFSRLAVRANNFAVAAVSPIMAIESVSQDLRVTSNDLGSSRRGGAFAGAFEDEVDTGCFVPKLTKIASTAKVAVQSSGDGCASPVAIPVGGGGQAGAVEITAWSTGAATVLSKVVVIGNVVHQLLPPSGSTGAIHVVGVVGGQVKLSTADGKPLSFTAMPLLG